MSLSAPLPHLIISSMRITMRIGIYVGEGYGEMVMRKDDEREVER
jgi:hypothetical protein